MVRVFANGLGDPGSISGRVIPKILKMVLDATLLNTQHYKVKVKWRNPVKEEAPCPTPWYRRFRNGRQLYHIYIYTGPPTKCFECLPMILDTNVQTQGNTYQKLKILYLISHLFTRSIIRYRSRRCPWCSRYHRRKWTRRYEFKSWTILIAFHIALIPLGKVWIQLLSLQLWVNSRTD